MRLARERFDDAQHQVQIRGPEGASTTFDKHKQVVRGDYTVQYGGFEAYMQRLADEGGFVIETQKSQTEGKFLGGVAALNILARLTGGEEITEDELDAAYAADARADA